MDYLVKLAVLRGLFRQLRRISRRRGVSMPQKAREAAGEVMRQARGAVEEPAKRLREAIGGPIRRAREAIGERVGRLRESLKRMLSERKKAPRRLVKRRARQAAKARQVQPKGAQPKPAATQWLAETTQVPFKGTQAMKATRVVIPPQQSPVLSATSNIGSASTFAQNWLTQTGASAATEAARRRIWPWIAIPAGAALGAYGLYRLAKGRKKKRTARRATRSVRLSPEELIFLSRLWGLR